MHFKHYSIIQVCLLHLESLIVLDVKFKVDEITSIVKNVV